MLGKRIFTALIATALVGAPTSRVSADGGDFVAGALIGGLIGAATQNERNKNRHVVVRRSRLPSTQEGREIQTSLNYFGFNAGGVDGQLGRRSRAAISRYQAYMGYPATGQLTPFEHSLLVTSYNRAMAGGAQVARLIAANPDGTRGLLKDYRAQLAGTAIAPAPAPAQGTAVTATAPAEEKPALPNFMGAATARSLASHCNKVSLLTNTNGGFVTQATMSDPAFALNEQFCLARTYAIAEGEELAAKVEGVSQQQIVEQCKALVPAMQDHIAALSLKPLDAVVQDVSSFVLNTGMSPAELGGTARICLSVGYRTDDMEMAIGSALLLVTVGERPYAELLGHHLSQGFGASRRTDLAVAWYDAALTAIDEGATPVFGPGQPERNGLIRKAAMTLQGNSEASGATGKAVPATAAIPSFGISQ